MKNIDICIDENKLPDGKIPKGTAQQKRQNKKTGAYFDSDNIAAARQFYTYIFNRARIKERIDTPLNFPTEIEIWYFYKTKEEKKIGKPKTTPPDLDNAVKLLIDCIVKAGIISDDRIIYHLNIRKLYSDTDEIYIKIRIHDTEDE